MTIYLVRGESRVYGPFTDESQAQRLVDIYERCEEGHVDIVEPDSISTAGYRVVYERGEAVYEQLFVELPQIHRDFVSPDGRVSVFVQFDISDSMSADDICELGHRMCASRHETMIETHEQLPVYDCVLRREYGTADVADVDAGTWHFDGR